MIAGEMRLGILSDIHDHVWNLAAALPALADCDILLCGGDLCSPFVIHQLGRGFPGPIHIVFGNSTRTCTESQQIRAIMGRFRCTERCLRANLTAAAW